MESSCFCLKLNLERIVFLGKIDLVDIQLIVYDFILAKF